MQSVVEDPMSHRGLAEISIWVVVVIVIILQTIAIMQLKQKPNEEITTNDWIGLDRTTPLYWIIQVVVVVLMVIIVVLRELYLKNI